MNWVIRPGQGISFAVLASWTIGYSKITSGTKKRPPGLLWIHPFDALDILQVLVVSDDMKWVPYSLPLFF